MPGPLQATRGPLFYFDAVFKKWLFHKYVLTLKMHMTSMHESSVVPDVSLWRVGRGDPVTQTAGSQEAGPLRPAL